MLLEFVGDLIKSNGSEFFYQINFTLPVYGSAGFLTRTNEAGEKGN